MALALALLVAGLAPACSDGDAEWCDRLRREGSLTELSRAVTSADADAAASAVEDFDDLAQDAPREIRDDMVAVADALGRAVEVATASEDAGTPSEMERRRDLANQGLAGVTAHSNAVTAWAERECGIRLGPS